MPVGTNFRLDTVDVALGLGWEVRSADTRDEFIRDGYILAVEYSPQSDEVVEIKGSGWSEIERPSQSLATTHAAIRNWLSGTPATQDRAESLDMSGRPLKLRWSREKWLHKPTQEVVDDGDPRVPRTISDAKKQNKIWYLMASQANVEDGHYRREMDAETMGAPEPTYTATWHPRGGVAEVLVRGSGSTAYSACVRHHQNRGL